MSISVSKPWNFNDPADYYSFEKRNKTRQVILRILTSPHYNESFILNIKNVQETCKYVYDILPTLTPFKQVFEINEETFQESAKNWPNIFNYTGDEKRITPGCNIKNTNRSFFDALEISDNNYERLMSYAIDVSLELDPTIKKIIII